MCCLFQPTPHGQNLPQVSGSKGDSCSCGPIFLVFLPDSEQPLRRRAECLGPTVRKLAGIPGACVKVQPWGQAWVMASWLSTYCKATGPGKGRTFPDSEALSLADCGLVSQISNFFNKGPLEKEVNLQDTLLGVRYCGGSVGGGVSF